MRRFIPLTLLVAFALSMTVGCGGDIVKQALATPELQAKVMDMIGTNGDMAGAMVDKLLAGDTKQMIMDKVTANADLMSGLVDKVAKDPAMLDKVLSVAVQDPALKTRIVEFVKNLPKK